MTDAQRVLAYLAVAAGVAGVLSTLPLGALTRALLLLMFLVSGVGSAVLCWVKLPLGAVTAGVVGLSIGGMILVSTTSVWLRWWHPTTICLTVSALVAVGGAARLRTAQQRARHAVKAAQK